jgi:hypothetical protein
MVHVLQVWHLVDRTGPDLRVRLVADGGRGARLEVGAGQDQMLVACAQYVASGWAVRMPLTEHLVKVATWPSAYGWMLEELHSLLPGRLVRVGQVHRRPIRVTS